LNNLGSAGGLLEVSNSRISRNNGDGIYALRTSLSSFTDSTVDNNGGIGLWMIDTGGAPATNIVSCTTITNNRGGGIRIDGTPMTIINSTISGNSATDGGGLLATNNPFGGDILLFNVTIVNNSAVRGGGIAVEPDLNVDYPTTVYLRASLIAANH